MEPVHDSTGPGRAPAPPAGHRREQGSAFLLAVIAMVLVFALGAVVSDSLNRSLYQTTDELRLQRTFAASEAGLHQAVYFAEAKLADAYGNSWKNFVAGELYVNKVSNRSYTGTLDAIPYEFWFEDNKDDGDQTQDADRLIWIYARANPARGRPRLMRALIEGNKPPVALDYALFGNAIKFHNHNGALFGVNLTTTVWSNSWITVDEGIAIQGQMTAVDYVRLDPAGGGLPAAQAVPSPLQGDSNPGAGVKQAVPAPAVAPFPTFNFAAAEAAATARGTRYASFANFLTALTNAANKVEYLPKAATTVGWAARGIPRVQVPTPGNLDQYFEVGDVNADGLYTAADGIAKVSVYTLAAPVAATADPADGNDAIFYIDDDCNFDYNFDKYFRIEGSVVCNGNVTIGSGGWILAYEERDSYIQYDTTATRLETSSILDYNGDNTADCGADKDGDGSLYDFRGGGATLDKHYSNWPAIVAAGKLEIKSGHGGAFHVEGTVFATNDSHVHRSDANHKAYIGGSEIANVVHNCEYLSFVYDIEVKNTIGFTETDSKRKDLHIVSYDEQPFDPGTKPYLGN